MSVTTTETVYTTKREMVKRLEAKNTKSELADAMADVWAWYQKTSDPDIEDVLDPILNKVLW